VITAPLGRADFVSFVQYVGAKAVAKCVEILSSENCERRTRKQVVAAVEEWRLLQSVWSKSGFVLEETTLIKGSPYVICLILTINFSLRLVLRG